jgi:hypothetical protein
MMSSVGDTAYNWQPENQVGHSATQPLFMQAASQNTSSIGYTFQGAMSPMLYGQSFYHEYTGLLQPQPYSGLNGQQQIDLTPLHQQGDQYADQYSGQTLQNITSSADQMVGAAGQTWTLYDSSAGKFSTTTGLTTETPTVADTVVTKPEAYTTGQVNGWPYSGQVVQDGLATQQSDGWDSGYMLPQPYYSTSQNHQLPSSSNVLAPGSANCQQDETGAQRPTQQLQIASYEENPCSYGGQQHEQSVYTGQAAYAYPVSTGGLPATYPLYYLNLPGLPSSDYILVQMVAVPPLLGKNYKPCF